MNDSLLLIDITSELGLYLKDSISLFNEYINSGEIKYKKPLSIEEQIAYLAKSKSVVYNVSVNHNPSFKDISSTG